MFYFLACVYKSCLNVRQSFDLNQDLLAENFTLATDVCDFTIVPKPELHETPGTKLSAQQIKR